MSYTQLAIGAIAVAVCWDRWLCRTRLLSRSSFWISYLILLVFQLCSNGILTGLRIVRYNSDAILGLRLMFAPVEDLAFGFALITITLSCWTRASGWTRGHPR